MKFTPRPYQQTLIEHGLNHPIHAWFVGMGLGKTAAQLQIWSDLLQIGEIKGVLLVAPWRVATLTFPNEIQKWEDFQWLKFANLRTPEGLKAWEEGSAHIYAINYERLDKFADLYIQGRKLQDLPADMVLFDELDNAKGHGSKRINTFRRHAHRRRGGAVFRMFKRWGGMTGTPVGNSRMDLFAQIRLLDNGERFGQNFTPWKEKHFEPINPWSDYPKFRLKEGHGEILEKQIADIAISLRAEDYKTWDAPTFEEREVVLPKAAMSLYKKLQKEWLVSLESGMVINAPQAGVLPNKLAQVTSGGVFLSDEMGEPTKDVQVIHTAKIDALREIRKEHPGEPVMVGCWYQHEQDQILKAFPDFKKFTPQILDEWNSGKVAGLVANPKSIGHGLNLQDGGKLIVWTTRPWSPTLFDQFNARLARQGQANTVKVISLVVKGTIDEAVGETLRLKSNDQNNFLQTLKNLRQLAESNK